jgi:hypothetical protein
MLRSLPSDFADFPRRLHAERKQSTGPNSGTSSVLSHDTSDSANQSFISGVDGAAFGSLFENLPGGGGPSPAQKVADEPLNRSSTTSADVLTLSDLGKTAVTKSVRRVAAPLVRCCADRPHITHHTNQPYRTTLHTPHPPQPGRTARAPDSCRLRRHRSGAKDQRT